MQTIVINFVLTTLCLLGFFCIIYSVCEDKTWSYGDIQEVWNPPTSEKHKVLPLNKLFVYKLFNFKIYI